MLKNSVNPHILAKRIGLLAFILTFQFLNAQKKVNFNFSGAVHNEVDDKALEGVKIELIKNKQVVQSMVTESNGKYKMNWEINRTDSNDANYTVNYTCDKMVPKSAKINTFIRMTLASSYNFVLDVYMTPRSEGDVIIDLPSAKIKWDERHQKFSVDQKYANIMKEIKQAEDPEKARKLIEAQKAEEEAQKRREEEAKRLAAEAEKRAAAEAMKKNMDALLKQQQELDRLAALQKAREDSAAAAAAKAAADALKKNLSAINKEIKKQDTARPVVVETPKSVVVTEAPPEEDEDEMTIKEIYSIRDVKALRARSYAISKDMQKRKIKNWSSKYETENPLTSLLDEIDDYEKNTKQPSNK